MASVWINVEAGTPYHYSPTAGHILECECECDNEFVELVKMWHLVPSWQDGTECGVMCDWLREHPEFFKQKTASQRRAARACYLSLLDGFREGNFSEAKCPPKRYKTLMARFKREYTPGS